MSERVTMPALGESVTEGTVTRWLKQVGEEVAVDEPLLEVSTDKVDTEIPSPVAGILQEVLVQEDETVPVGIELVVINDSAAASTAPEPTSEHEAPEPPSTKQETLAVPLKTEASPFSSDSEVTDNKKITMPTLGESVTEGTITRWLKAEGDDVEVDEPLLEVSTDKVDIEVPSPVAGKVSKILVQEDETVPVDADLAIIGNGIDIPAEEGDAPAEKKPTISDPAPVIEAPKQPESTKAPTVSHVPAAPTVSQQSVAPASREQSADRGDASTYITPLVRKLAAENNIDFSNVTGTGVGGRIRKQDVLGAAEKAKQSEPIAAPTPAESAASAATSAEPSIFPQVSAKRGTTEKMTRMRKLIATRMVESLQVSAQLSTVVEVDVTKITRLRTKTKATFEQREGLKLSFIPFFALAAIEALKAYPQLNASVEDDSIIYHPQENLGIAVDTTKGLFVPVIQNAGDLNITGLARKVADLASRTRSNKVTPDELGGGTFTLTNTGSRGALFDTPIINQPQVGILGTGAVTKRPVVITDVDGDATIAVRSMVYLALSYDHRIIDGADAACFLSAVKQRLEEGTFEI